MKFSEIDIEQIQMDGYDKMLIMREGQMFLGGAIRNVLLHKNILDEKEIITQFGDQGVWIIEIL